MDAGFAGLIGAPILVAAVAPVGEVGFGDGLVIEFFGEEFFGLGEAIKPLQEFGALLAVFEAAVELVPDGFGELGDFAEAGFHRIFFNHGWTRMWTRLRCASARQDGRKGREGRK